jgi:hypothetical protein
MSEKQQHPSVQQFKQFVKKHPGLVQEVRNNNRKWQEIYEEWHILGEDDPMWSRYKSKDSELKQPIDKQTNKNKGKNKKKNSELLGQMWSIFKNMDMNELQHHISNASNAISNIQELMDQLQSSNQKSPQSQQPYQQSPQSQQPYQSHQSYQPPQSQQFQRTQNDPFSFRKD